MQESPLPDRPCPSPARSSTEMVPTALLLLLSFALETSLISALLITATYKMPSPRTRPVCGPCAARVRR